MLLPIFSQILLHTDTTIMLDALWGLSYISSGPSEHIEMVIDMGMVPSLVQFLSHPSDKAIIAALRCVGNIATGSDSQTQRLLDAGMLNHLRALLCHTKTRINKESTWLISNITAGTTEQIQEVIESGLLKEVIVLLGEGEFSVQREAVWVLTNVAVSGTPSQVMYLVNHGVLEPFCNMLVKRDTELTEVILDGIYQILIKSGEELERVSQMLEECEGLDKIERLQNHPNKNIYKQALKIIETFFADEDEPIAENASFVFDSTKQNVPSEGFSFK